MRAQHHRVLFPNLPPTHSKMTYIYTYTYSYTYTNTYTYMYTYTYLALVQHTAAHCNTLQHTATHCNSMKLTATNSMYTYLPLVHEHTRKMRAQHYRPPFFLLPSIWGGYDE